MKPRSVIVQMKAILELFCTFCLWILFNLKFGIMFSFELSRKKMFAFEYSRLSSLPAARGVRAENVTNLCVHRPPTRK